jgi:hypothetical protein
MGASVVGCGSSGNRRQIQSMRFLANKSEEHHRIVDGPNAQQNIVLVGENDGKLESDVILTLCEEWLSHEQFDPDYYYF